MLKNCIWLVAGIVAVLTITANPVHAEQPYGVLKIGPFIPNGSGSATEAGLKDFDTGFNVEAGGGFYLAPYALVEVTAGYYAAERTNSTATTQDKSTITGIPVTAVIKGVMTSGPFELSLGAGAGYYYASIDRNNSAGSMTAHGNALGYVVSGAADYQISENMSLGVDIKWFSAKPKIDLTKIGETETKWEVGGTTLDVTAKYRF